MFNSEVSSRSGNDYYDSFRREFSSIRESFSRANNPENAAYKPMSEEFNQMANSREFLAKERPVEFRGEEGYARYIDLTTQHMLHNNLPGLNTVQYLQYLDTFDRLYEIPLTTKMNSKYKEYLGSLIGYMIGYLSRAKPLVDFEKTEMEEISSNFEMHWKQGTFTGWSDSFLAKYCLKSGGHSQNTVNLYLYENSEQLEALGTDRLKLALDALGLKCGGTPQQRAERLFATKGKKLSDLDASFFPKNKKRPISEANLPEIKNSLKHIALMEAQIYKLVELLGQERADTKNNVIRKQSLTAEERINEFDKEDQISDDEIVEDEKDEEDHGTIYNPKNLPLGWDGKPIPYWLYKLHGLNLKFTCEICGNHTYLGPKAFIRHFSEWRHSHGMKCLGIPNTAHFSNVTLIEDAITIWEKMCAERE